MVGAVRGTRKGPMGSASPPNGPPPAEAPGEVGAYVENAAAGHTRDEAVTHCLTGVAAAHSYAQIVQETEKAAVRDVAKLELEEQGEIVAVMPPIGPMPEGEDTRSEVQEIRDEEASEGAEPYFAPTDPVLNDRGRELVGGFDETSMDEIDVEPSTLDEEPGDEALAEAVRRELHEDALTSHLRLAVEVKHGVVYIRGSADAVEDTDDAAEVASRVPGVQRVVADIETPES